MRSFFVFMFFLIALTVAGAVKNGDAQTRTTELEQLQAKAASGDAEAQFNLGVIYDNGEGVPRDYKAAREWFRKAAEQGNAMAQNSLGLMYADGQDEPQDYQKAAEWIRKAAEQGHTNAQASLGWMYANGKGVPQDYSQAYMWSNIAAASGHGIAPEDRDRLLKMMTFQQIEEGQRLT